MPCLCTPLFSKFSENINEAKVDMTPMVDLGFLLITFFIFTSTMSQPTAMNLFMPKDVDKPEEQNKVKESGAFTLMLGKEDVVYYYEGMDPSTPGNFRSASFKTIRDEIIRKKQSTNPEDLVIIIKPTNDATYKNTVDMLDEMTINEIKVMELAELNSELYDKLFGPGVVADEKALKERVKSDFEHAH